MGVRDFIEIARACICRCHSGGPWLENLTNRHHVDGTHSNQPVKNIHEIDAVIVTQERTAPHLSGYQTVGRNLANCASPRVPRDFVLNRAFALLPQSARASPLARFDAFSK